MDFRVLGPVEVSDDGLPRVVGGGRERFVLAMLLLGAGRSTSAARLIDALWDSPPSSAKAQLHNMISRLRRALAGRDGLIVTNTAGYELRLGADTLDLLEFRRLVAQGLRSRAEGDAALTVALLGEALALWRGPALADIPDELAAAARQALHEEKLAAAEARLDAEFALGRNLEVVDAVTALLAEHPYRENLYQTKMLALLGAGRAGEALETYRQANSSLVDGLGIEPGPALRELERRILADRDVPVREAPVVVRQLPPTTAVLTGRDQLVAEIGAALTGPEPVLAVLVGPGGVGKTTLALAAAAEVADAFPGGQLYADLRGSQDNPADPHAVVGRFLSALEVRQSKLPRDPDERLAMYRGLVAGSRMLVVLDDAADEEQVRPLRPDCGGCATLVTSRRHLGALAGATRWTVPELAPADAVELLGRLIGRERTAAEPEAAAALAAVCGQLPLAVSIVAARLAVRPDWTLEEFSQRLARERDRLDELAVGDLDVRASIALSYHSLSERGRRLLRLLALVAAPDWPAWVPRVLMGDAAGDAPAALAELVDVHLVARVGTRYRLHDLVAVFAGELADEEQAAHRLLEGWLALAVAADEQVPHGETFALPVAVGKPPVPVPDAYEWFDEERPSLLVAVAEAVRLGRPDLAGHLALRMSGYLELRCWYDDWLAALDLAIGSVREAGLDELLIRLLSALFAAHGLADRYAEQPAVAEEELAVARRLGDRTAEVTALCNASRALRDLGRFREAARLLDEAMELAPEAAEPVAGAVVLRIKTGEPELALELLAKVRVDDGSARSALYHYLKALALVDVDRLPEAAATAATGLEIATRIGDDVGVAYLTWVQATVDIRAARWRSAGDLLEQALRASEKLGAFDVLAETLRALGDLAAAQGRNTAAIGALHRAMEIWRRLGVEVQVARTLARLERVLRAAGDSAAATACQREWRTVLAELELDERCLRLPPFLVR